MIRQGKFGPIQVVQTDEVQQVRLNGQVQGSVFLSPTARSVGIDVDGPGPVSASAYSYGWLIAGVHRPYGSGVMVGLGSGVGVVQLLYNFPHIDLTVIEIDPVMVEVALRSLPLLDHYMNEGRLNIIIADAAEALDTSDRYTFGCADAYDGGASFQLLTGYLTKLCQVCDDVYINAIDSPLGRHISAISATCFDAGNPLLYGMRAVAPEVAHVTAPKANYVLTSADVQLPDLDAFIPFAALTQPAADYGRLCWNLMISDVLDVGG
jgi:hypothetical protein